MENLTEKTAQIYDSIIRKALETGSATEGNLPPLSSDDFVSDLREVKYQHYIHYVRMLRENHSDIVKISVFNGRFAVEPIKISTKEFIDNGGFVGVFNKQAIKDKDAEKFRAMEQKKIEYDLSYSKFLAKHKYWPYIISGISVLISLALLVWKLIAPSPK